jgi:hypothetical protein
MSESGHDVWSGLSPDEIERSKQFYDGTARMAWSYSCSILIGCPREPTEFTSSATGVFLRLGQKHFVVTARHVVSGYEEMLRKMGHAHFQIGQLTVCPQCRLALDDTINDIAIIRIEPPEVAEVGRTPYVVDDWPLPSPKVGQQIQFCGYARINRVDGDSGQIDSTVLPLIADVSNASESHFSVRIERDKYRWQGERLLQSDQAFLGGMSGGPALLLNDPSFPLVGIVSEGNESWDIVYFRSLATVPWNQLI